MQLHKMQLPFVQCAPAARTQRDAGLCPGISCAVLGARGTACLRLFALALRQLSPLPAPHAGAGLQECSSACQTEGVHVEVTTAHVGSQEVRRMPASSPARAAALAARAGLACRSCRHHANSILHPGFDVYPPAGVVSS